MWSRRGAAQPVAGQGECSAIPSGENPAREQTAPSCTSEEPMEGLETTSPLLRTCARAHTHMRVPFKSESWRRGRVSSCKHQPSMSSLSLQPPSSTPKPCPTLNKDAHIWRAGSGRGKGEGSCLRRQAGVTSAARGQGEAWKEPMAQRTAARPLPSQIPIHFINKPKGHLPLGQVKGPDVPAGFTSA